MERWSEAGRERYAALLAAAIRALARAPEGPMTRDRAELAAGVRSFHVRYARGARSVREPVHVIYYRIVASAIEIVRVLHERMEPTRHVGRRRPGRNTR